MHYMMIQYNSAAASVVLDLPPRVRLPRGNLLLHARNDVLHSARLAERVDEAPRGVHEVEEDRVVDEVVVVRLGVRRRREVHAIRLARRLDRAVFAREPDQPRVEVGDVARDLGDRVARGVDGDEYGLHDGAVLLVCAEM